ncbi:hypothetical protein [Morganella psychrotolerans]|uniref:hypothetical protein n=1 Tax=Morganella psychrotolerans TaxID=368603 RepID=UPI0012E93019|nr:hypothetical protein [Morganella psychrotolerans]
MTILTTPVSATPEAVIIIVLVTPVLTTPEAVIIIVLATPVLITQKLTTPKLTAP